MLLDQNSYLSVLSILHRKKLTGSSDRVSAGDGAEGADGRDLTISPKDKRCLHWTSAAALLGVVPQLLFRLAVRERSTLRR